MIFKCSKWCYIYVYIITDKEVLPMRFNHFLILVFTILTITRSFSFEFSVSGEQHVDTDEQYQVLNTALTHDFYDALFVADLSYYTDNKSSPALKGNYYSGYFFLEQGGFIWKKENFEFSIGRLAPVSMIESPYSLFISSNEISTITSNFYIESTHFFFQTQWIQLNQNSTIKTDEFEKGFPDRGANIRYYGLQFGDMRFGLKDSALYYGRSFDLEYFVNPLPSYFIQHINTSPGKPWQQNDNENALVGLFFDFTRPDYYIYSQVILDDLNVHMFFDDSHSNPNKIGWSMGGTYNFTFGKMGFYHVGATKYLFEPTRNRDPYGYTYYPDSTYYLTNGTEVGIKPEDNYIGYKYGENNLAFLISYIPEISYLDLKGELEFVVSGSKSPVNPWHQYTEYEQGGLYTKMLDESPLEKRISLNIDAVKQLSEGLSIYSNVELGYIWNKLELTAVPQEYIDYYENQDSDFDDTLEYDTEYLKYFSPSSDSEPIASFSIGVTYSYSPF